MNTWGRQQQKLSSRLNLSLRLDGALRYGSPISQSRRYHIVFPDGVIPDFDVDDEMLSSQAYQSMLRGERTYCQIGSLVLTRYDDTY